MHAQDGTFVVVADCVVLEVWLVAVVIDKVVLAVVVAALVVVGIGERVVVSIASAVAVDCDIVVARIAPVVDWFANAQINGSDCTTDVKLHSTQTICGASTGMLASRDPPFPVWTTPNGGFRTLSL